MFILWSPLNKRQSHYWRFWQVTVCGVGYVATSSLSASCSRACFSLVYTYYFLFYFILIYVCMYVCMAALGLHCCTWAFSNYFEQGLLLLQSTGSRHPGFSSCSTRTQQLWLTGSRAQAQQLWCTGLVALWHVESSRTRAQTRVPCIGRRILNHCTTREVPPKHLF